MSKFTHCNVSIGVNCDDHKNRRESEENSAHAQPRCLISGLQTGEGQLRPRGSSLDSTVLLVSQPALQEDRNGRLTHNKVKETRTWQQLPGCEKRATTPSGILWLTADEHDSTSCLIIADASVRKYLPKR